MKLIQRLTHKNTPKDRGCAMEKYRWRHHPSTASKLFDQRTRWNRHCFLPLKLAVELRIEKHISIWLPL